MLPVSQGSILLVWLAGVLPPAHCFAAHRSAEPCIASLGSAQHRLAGPRRGGLRPFTVYQNGPEVKLARQRNHPIRSPALVPDASEGDNPGIGLPGSEGCYPRHPQEALRDGPP